MTPIAVRCCSRASIPRLSAAKVVQRTDDSFKVVFSSSRSIPAFPTPLRRVIGHHWPWYQLPGPMAFLRAEQHRCWLERGRKCPHRGPLRQCGAAPCCRHPCSEVDLVRRAALPTAVAAGGDGISLASRCSPDGTANSNRRTGVRRYQIKLRAAFSSPAGLWALSRYAQT